MADTPPSQRRRPKTDVLSIGNRKLQPNTLMMGHGYDPANERFFTPGRDGHFQFDLEAYVAQRLAAAGLTRVEMLGLDTYANPGRYFSFRRATHRGESGYGRQISLIGLPVRTA